MDCLAVIGLTLLAALVAGLLVGYRLSERDRRAAWASGYNDGVVSGLRASQGENAP